MIEIQQLTEKDLAVLKQKKVVLFGDAEKFQMLTMILNYFGISVFAIYSNNISVLKKKAISSVPIISIVGLNILSKNNENLIFQSSSVMPDSNDLFKKYVGKLGFDFSNLPVGQIYNSFIPLVYSESLKTKSVRDFELTAWRKERTAVTNGKLEKLIRKKKLKTTFLCLPMKTADYTLNNTFNEINKKSHSWPFLKTESKAQENYFVVNKIVAKLEAWLCKDTCSYLNLFHKPQYIEKLRFAKQFETIKIITAVREPVSQNVSSLFEEFVTGRLFVDWILGDIENVGTENVTTELEKTTRFFLAYQNDAQAIFDAFINRYIYPVDEVEKNSLWRHAIQKFTSVFKDNVLDITAYPFDKEKGYTIIKEGNLEVFVYQLEKLNCLVLELSEWIGVPFDKLENGNQASDKWIADSYKQAQKEIEITQEYFDKCFNEPYVKHCYSEADIEKFKARWRPHIKKEL